MAILPSSLNNIYPQSNKNLAKEIIANDGCLVSEYIPDTKILNSNFIQRDRLQSAFSDVVLAIETEINGGTMHTVNYAHAQNKIIACFNLLNDREELPSGNKIILEIDSVHKLENTKNLTNLIKNISNLKKQPDINQPNLF